MIRAFVAVFCAARLAFACYGEGPEDGVEAPPIFLAQELVSPDLIKGEWHQLRPVVEVANYSYVFRIKSSFGDYEAVGTQQLKQRLKEIEAIAAINQVSQSEAFVSTVSRSLQDPFWMTVGIAKRPISTVMGLPAGLGRYVQGKFYQARRTTGKAIDKVKELREKDNREDESASADERTMTERVSSSAGKLSRKHLGYDKAKRAWARHLGVDPYSDNTALHEALGRVAWASSLGSFAAGYAMPSSEVISYAGKTQELVWDQPPHQLERFVENTLKKRGISKEEALAFVDHESYSLSEKTYFALCLEGMGEVEGVTSVVPLILGASSREDVRFILRTFRMLGSYCETLARIDRLRVYKGMIVADSSNGYLVLPLAADYLYWDALSATVFAESNFPESKKEIWLSGEASPIATHGLESNGWYVRQRCIPLVEVEQEAKKP